MPTRPRLVIVDDDPSVREFLRRNFEDRFTVFSAADGRTGIEITDLSEPDVVIVDFAIPEIPGDQVLRILQEAQRTPARLILLTAHPDGPAMARDLGVPLLRKPFRLEQLEALVD
ncbi:MAG: response regulator [Candidatus Limnocylindria bacterium]